VLTLYVASEYAQRLFGSPRDDPTGALDCVQPVDAEDFGADEAAISVNAEASGAAAEEAYAASMDIEKEAEETAAMAAAGGAIPPAAAKAGRVPLFEKVGGMTKLEGGRGRGRGAWEEGEVRGKEGRGEEGVRAKWSRVASGSVSVTASFQTRIFTAK